VLDLYYIKGGASQNAAYRKLSIVLNTLSLMEKANFSSKKQANSSIIASKNNLQK